jgi:hypothetical protein
MGFDFREVQEIFLFPTASGLVLVAAPPPVKWVPVTLARDRVAGRKVDYPPRPRPRLRIRKSLPPLLPTYSLCLYLIENSENAIIPSHENALLQIVSFLYETFIIE